MAAVTTCSDFGALENKDCHCFLSFPSYLPWSDRIRSYDLSFFEYWDFLNIWILILCRLLHAPLLPSSSSSFAFFKRLFGSSLLSAVRVVSPMYWRLLITLLAVLCPAYTSSSLTVCMVYSEYELNRQSDNIQPWHTPFPILSWSVLPWKVLTVASWPAYRFLMRQVSWYAIPVSLTIVHSLVWSTWSKALV